MSTTVLPAVINYLVDVFTAAPTIGAATPPITVYDGPQAIDPGELTKALYVAVDNPGVGDGASIGPVAAELSWQWAGLGAQRRYELFSVACTAVCVDPNSNLRTARQGCMDIFAAVDAVLVPGDVSLGNQVVFITGLSQGQLRTEQFDIGAVSWFTFAVEAKSRI
jgi:hypothetical protein